MLVPETSLEAKNACAPRSSNAVVQNAINACGTARNDKRDDYNRIIRAWNEMTQAYFDLEAAFDMVPEAKKKVNVRQIYSAIGKAHAELKKWAAS
jgi:hypothetical protein